MAGSMGVAVAGFLPWSRGGRSRSGFELARTLREVGLAPGGAPGVLLVLFVFTPMLAAGVWIAALTRRHRLAALGAGVTGSVAVACAVVLGTTPLRTGVGADAAMTAGILAIAGAAVLVFRGREGEG